MYVDGVHRISEPVWSPGGDQIAFTGVHDEGNRDIFVATLPPPFGPIAEVRARRLTDDPALDEFPAWSEDGSTILYDNAGAKAARRLRLLLQPKRSGASRPTAAPRNVSPATRSQTRSRTSPRLEQSRTGTTGRSGR